MNNVTIQEPSYKLKIEYDDIPINPRTDYDNFGKMVCWHSRYDLGDKHEFSEPSEFLKQLVDADNDSLEDLSLNELKELADKNNVIMPLYLYDHSGISISCSNTYPYNDRWDAGQVGWIYASYDDIQKKFGGINSETLEKVKDILIGETTAYDYYLCGECYGYTIEKNGVEVESCWGYLGDLREMVSEMKSGVDKEYQHLFDHIDYCCMEYTEDENTRRAAQEKPSVRKQLSALKPQTNSTISQEPEQTRPSLEL